MMIAIGLGSNINPEVNLAKAADLLRTKWPHIRFSSVYASAPVERADQPEFLNAAAIVDTDQSISTVIASLQSIEQQLGKSPPHRFGPRTIDLDLLLYGDQIVPDLPSWIIAKKQNDPADQTLYVPHVRMDERRFVLEPLMELSPEGMHPALCASIRSLWQKSIVQVCRATDIQL